MDRILIVNADDLGLCACVSRGIEQAYREGILTSATLMANCPGFDEGARVARDNPDLGIGIHLNLVRGRPLSPADSAAPLLDENGLFRSGIGWLRKASKRPEVLAAAEREYRAQIERVLAAGIRPTHLDSEKHHAVWQPLRRLQCRLADDYGLAVRSLCEPVWYALRKTTWPGWPAARDAAILRTYATLFNRPHPHQPDHFFGQTHIGQIDEPYLLALLDHLPGGVSELMCHPGYSDPEELQRLAPEIGHSRLADHRETELDTLTCSAAREKIRKKGIVLSTFGHLKDA